MLKLRIGNILDNRKEDMMVEKTVTLSSITIDGRGTYGIGAKAVPYSDKLYTYLRITDIKDDGTLDLQNLKSVDDEKAKQYLLRPNDIVFARTGASTGRNYFYDGTDGEFVYAGFLIKYSIDEKKVNPKYVKYYCQSKQYKNWINSFNTGSTRGNINAKTFNQMPIPLIDRKKQDVLVSILSSVDAKINENKKINKNLEKINLYGSGVKKITLAKNNKIKNANLNCIFISNFEKCNFNPKKLKTLKICNTQIKKVNLKKYKNLKKLSVTKEVKVIGCKGKKTIYDETL